MARRLPVPGLGPDASTSTLTSTSGAPDRRIASRARLLTRHMVGHAPRTRVAHGRIERLSSDHGPMRRSASASDVDQVASATIGIPISAADPAE